MKVSLRDFTSRGDHVMHVGAVRDHVEEVKVITPINRYFRIAVVYNLADRLAGGDFLAVIVCNFNIDVGSLISVKLNYLVTTGGCGARHSDFLSS